MWICFWGLPAISGACRQAPKPAPPAPKRPAKKQRIAPPAPPPASRYGRARKEKTRYGDSENEGPAKRFKSTIAPPKAIISAEEEVFVPEFCTVGANVRVLWSRQLFAARVEAIRAKFPRIVVRFTADAEGRTHRIALPEPVTAYVHSGLVSQAP